MRRSLVMGVGLAVLLSAMVSPALAKAPAAAKHFKQGQQLLAEGDFDGALAAYKAAAKADPDKDEYFRHAAILQRVMQMRVQLERTQDPELCDKIGTALHGYYLQNKVHEEALTLAKSMYAKDHTGPHAELLVETHLAMGQDREAAEFCASLPKECCTPREQVLHGIALARLGKTAEAKAITAELQEPKKCDRALCYDAARLLARVGDQEAACRYLTAAFEATPAGWLNDAKLEAKDCADFAELVKSPAFLTVLTTKSKVEGCGGCASSGSCSKEKSGCGDAKQSDCKESKSDCADKQKQAERE